MRAGAHVRVFRINYVRAVFVCTRARRLVCMRVAGVYETRGQRPWRVRACVREVPSDTNDNILCFDHFLTCV